MKAIIERLKSMEEGLRKVESEIDSIDRLKPTMVSFDSLVNARIRQAHYLSCVSSLNFALLEITRDEVNKAMEERPKV